MTNDSKKILYNDLKIAGFSAYFLFLFCERVLALIFSVKKGGAYALSSGSPFAYATYIVTALSLFLGTVLFVRLFIIAARDIRKGERNAFGWKAREWGVAATAMLFGGTMNTGFRVPWLQIIAYICLCAGMVVRCVESCESRDKFIPIVSTIYLTLFAMSIPVCNLINIEIPWNAVYYAVEFTAVAVLVPSFGIMFSRLVRTGTVLFSPSFIILLFLLSGATVGIAWTVEIHYFRLIALALSIVFYLSFGLIARHRQIALMQGVKP